MKLQNNICEKITILFFILVSFLGCTKKKDIQLKNFNSKDIIMEEDKCILDVDIDTSTFVIELFNLFIERYSNEYAIGNSNSNMAHTLIEKTNYSLYENYHLRQKEPFKNKYNQIDYQKIDCFVFKYDSKFECSVAIDSLFNCFPFECQVIPQNEYIESIKITPSIFIFNETSILIGTTFCEHINEKWDNFKADMIKTFSSENSKIINIECGGPLEWVQPCK